MKMLRDAVYGFAVGDALGVPYEFRDRGTFQCTDMIGGGTWNQPAGTWSDDTSMLLATCDSIRACVRIIPEDMMIRFGEWLFKCDYTANGNVFDVGGTTERAINRFMNGTPLEECGERSNLSCGNGSLMRILPLAFTGTTFETVEKISGLTHKHPLCAAACRAYIGILIFLSRGQTIQDWIEDVEIITKEYRRLKYILDLPESEIKSTGYVVDTLEAAVWCFGTSHSYSEAVLKAVNLGGDTDTIAALTGGLAGAYYGYDAIPKEWIEKLRNKELIDRCLFNERIFK